jgi:hypothetical protein
MFGRTVSIGGVEVFVTCTPDTPYSEICLRAAKQFKAEEEHEQRMKALDAMRVDADFGSPQDSAP